MVAPNSPIALAKAQDHAGDDAGSDERQRHGHEHPDRIGAERGGCILEPAVDRLDRQPDRPHHQRKAHDGAGECGAGPAEGEDDAEVLGEECADRSAAAEERAGGYSR